MTSVLTHRLERAGVQDDAVELAERVDGRAHGPRVVVGLADVAGDVHDAAGVLLREALEGRRDCALERDEACVVGGEQAFGDREPQAARRAGQDDDGSRDRHLFLD